MLEYRYVASAIYPWSSLQAPGVELDFSGDGSCGFLLVFDSLQELQEALGEDAEYFVVTPAQGQK